MPNTTIWIRVENLEQWEAIVKKSKWVNDHLVKEQQLKVKQITENLGSTTEELTYEAVDDNA